MISISRLTGMSVAVLGSSHRPSFSRFLSRETRIWGIGNIVIHGLYLYGIRCATQRVCRMHHVVEIPRRVFYCTYRCQSHRTLAFVSFHFCCVDDLFIVKTPPHLGFHYRLPALTSNSLQIGLSSHHRRSASAFLWGMVYSGWNDVSRSLSSKMSRPSEPASVLGTDLQQKADEKTPSLALVCVVSV